MMERKHHSNSRRAQAATELAVFGAILIFLIGGIIRSAVSSGYQQNQQLKAMRFALLQSYQSRQTATINGNSNGNPGRNSVSVLYIDDRISPDLAKFGSSERTPFIAQGTGTMTNMLYVPIDPDEYKDGTNLQDGVNKNLPGTDVYINGKHFRFTTARLRENVSLTPPAVPSSNPPLYYATAYSATGAIPDPRNDGTHRYKGWDFVCTLDSVTNTYYGCPIFYHFIVRGGKETFCDADPCDYLTAKERFDLNRNDDFTDDPVPDDPAPAGKVSYKHFGWQWVGMRGLQSNIKIDAKEGVYPSLDVSNSGQESSVFDAGPKQDKNSNPRGIISTVTFLDPKAGDLDFTQSNVQPQPGLQNDSAIYTLTNEGTYLQVKEGKVYNPETGLFVRSTNRNDQAELISRLFRLSNDTDHLCPGNNPVLPVEACNDCSNATNIKLTCFDRSSKVLYIRTRILDKRSHFWKTDLGAKSP